MFSISLASTLVFLLINLKIGACFPDTDLCLLGLDNPVIVAYCQKLGFNTDEDDESHDETWVLYEEKRASPDQSNEFVPSSEEGLKVMSSSSEEQQESLSPEKRKLGDSLRLGKKSVLDETQIFGRHSRLFEQMRLGKRSDPSKEKKKEFGRRLSLTDTIRMGKRMSLSDSLRMGKRMSLTDSLRIGKRSPLSDSLRMGKRIPLSDSLRMGKRIPLSDSLRMGKRMPLSDSLRMGKRAVNPCSSLEIAKRLALGDSLRIGKKGLIETMRLGKRIPLSDALRMGKRGWADKRIMLGDSLRMGKRDYPVYEWIGCTPSETEQSGEISTEQQDSEEDSNPDDILNLSKRNLLDRTLRMG